MHASDKIRRRPFRVEPLELKVIALPEADLRKFLGSFVGEDGPAQAEVVLKAGKLQVRTPGLVHFESDRGVIPS